MEENRRLIVPALNERRKLASVGVAYVLVYTRHIVSLGKHEIDISRISVCVQI